MHAANSQTPRTALVTGATGHLGYNLVRHLIDHGYAVRAGVRDRRDRQRNAPLITLGIELVEADLHRPDTLRAASEGADAVFHTAAVVKMWAKDPRREIITPTIQGGLAVLRAARAGGVGRVIFTSSLAAVGIDSAAEDPLTEDDWNDEPLTPYTIAKTQAEREAWELAAASGLDLVVVNPASIIGPGVYRHTPITLLFELVIRRRVPFVLPADTSYVDARDVAAAMRLAYERPAARGRYILSGGFVAMTDLMRLIERAHPRIRAPRRVFPIGWLPLLVAGDYLAAKLVGTERQITRAMIPEFAGKQMHCSSAKAQRELGWSPRPIADSVADTVGWIRERFVDS